MAGGNMDPDSRVALAEIKGDVKLVLAGQERTHSDIASINKRLDTHDGRIGQLETDKNMRDGERRGVGLVVKVGYVLGGSGIMGFLALVARHFGL